MPRSSSLPSHPLLAASLLSSLATATLNFNCKDVVSQRVQWDLSELGGPRMVHWVRDIEPATHNFTFTLDICKPLKKHKGQDPHELCPGNTRVCGVEYVTNNYDNVTTVSQVVPIAGDYHLNSGQPLESEVYRLKGSGSNSDSNKEGVRVELSGGREKYTDDKGKEQKGKKQKAVIEFLCDPNTDGKDTEVDDRPEDDSDKKEESMLRRRDEEDSEKDPEKKPEEKPRSLQFLSYKEESIKDEVWDVLRLEWNTKYACENAVNEPKEGAGGSWGFFTWLIIVLFLATAAYLIFGSWMNYNRYGARGWDALPHGDTLRDLPYIMSDFGRKVTNTIQGGGSRGGYSAV